MSAPRCITRSSGPVRVTCCESLIIRRSIFLIAGTYTPFVLVPLHGQLGWLLFAIVWSLAVMGIVFKSFAVDRFASRRPWYIWHGWLVVFARRPLLHALTWHGVFWIALGGLFIQWV